MKVMDKSLADAVQDLVLEGFTPNYGILAERFPTSALWQKMRKLDTQLWLDTGDIAAASCLWTREFDALTTNNTLLNKEVQKGTYDQLVQRSAQRLRELKADLSDEDLVREIAFILNAYHALRLVERFDAFVSVELHTDLARDIEGTVSYGKRYFAICPQRFIIKVPLTAEGLVAAGRLRCDNIPVNFTLGFSARQNVLITTVAQPRFCNVFLGRLNQVVAENGLGAGEFVGERAVAASQAAVRQLCADKNLPTRQIAASLRNGRQVQALAGVDVMTMPPAAAQEFQELGIEPADLQAGIDRDFRPEWANPQDYRDYGFQTLWEVPDGLQEAADRVSCRELADMDGPAILDALDGRGLHDVLPEWSREDIRAARADGKIPKLERWKARLAAGDIGLDALMTLHALASFAQDQRAMDDRIREHLG